MPATVIAAQSKAQDSRVLMSNHGSKFAKILTYVGATKTATLEDSVGFTGKSLYAAATPGLGEIIEKASGVTATVGNTANVTSFVSDTVIFDVDLALAAGDIVLIAPPLSVELFANGGHSLGMTLNDDESMGLTETFITHNTRLGTTVQGDVPFFVSRDSEGLARILAFGCGAYKKSAVGVHQFQPLKASDGTFADSSEATFTTIDGNGVVKQVFGALFSTQVTIDYPENGIATGTLSVLGAAAAREIGGAGKTYPSGASAYIPTTATLGTDAGSRHTFVGVFLELGGAFGSGLSSPDRFVKSATVTIGRGAVSDPVLGNQFIAKPIEDTQTLTISGRRILENTAFYDKYIGGSTAAGPGFHTESRVLLKAVHPGNTSRTLTVDIPRAKIRCSAVRQRGRFLEDFTVTALQTLTGTGAVDTAAPLYRISYDNGVDIDVLSAL